MTSEEDKFAELKRFGNFFQEDWIKGVIDLALSDIKGTKVILLAGDAGTGKTYALTKLYTRACKLNIPILMTATTHTAVSVLNGELKDCVAKTTHSAFGFKDKMITGKFESSGEFMVEYKRTWRKAISTFEAIMNTPAIDTAIRKTHSCQQHALACLMCDQAAHERMGNTVPEIVGKKIILIDEYGLVTAQMYSNIMSVLDLYTSTRTNEGPIVIFSGSVSQLTPPDVNKNGVMGIWDSTEFKQDLVHRQPLLINRRQLQDLEYGEALSMMQYNMMTEQGLEIFKSRVNCTMEESFDPNNIPKCIRVYHQNAQRAKYINNVVEKIEKTSKRSTLCEPAVKLVRNKSSKDGICEQSETLKQLCVRYPNLFSAPTWDPNKKFRTIQEYVRSKKLWVGSTVKIINFGTFKPPDTSGEITRIIDDSTVEVKSSRLGTIFIVGQATDTYKNWSVTVTPVTPSVALNTYEAQGATVKNGVLYHPPGQYHQSPVKPSAYVACSRVTSREHLHLTSTSFLPQAGQLSFYPGSVVMYRKEFEMVYTN